jgi:hypothetical protein
MERPVTPPPGINTLASLNITPEQVKRIELNRLKGVFSNSHLMNL